MQVAHFGALQISDSYCTISNCSAVTCHSPLGHGRNRTHVPCHTKFGRNHLKVVCSKLRVWQPFHEILAENFRSSQVVAKVAEHLISANRSQVTGLEQFEMVQYCRMRLDTFANFEVPLVAVKPNQPKTMWGGIMQQLKKLELVMLPEMDEDQAKMEA
jgi:hypothetical protein